MNLTRCESCRRKLGAFVDGELSGSERLSVSRHLTTCEECADHLQHVRDLGQMLRDAVALVPPSTELGGLAGGVISRVRAEQAQSWKAMLARAVEDWHWLMVGAGSVAASFVSALLVSGLVLLGPLPEREDSLAALLNNLGSPAGTLFVLATPVGNDKNSMIMQFDNGTGGQNAGPTTVMPAEFVSPTESELVRALDSSLVTPEGRITDVRAMSEKNRRYTEGLLEQLGRLRFSDPRGAAGHLTVHQIGLVANTSVTAKPL
jgi:hypothetical protein